MINNPPTQNTARCLIRTALLLVLVSPWVFPNSAAEAKEPKYKKNTVVDFEGALVEGKSRKPYSAYLTQQREAAFSQLSDWKLDVDHSLSAAHERLDQSK